VALEALENFLTMTPYFGSSFCSYYYSGAMAGMITTEPDAGKSRKAENSLP